MFVPSTMATTPGGSALPEPPPPQPASTTTPSSPTQAARRIIPRWSPTWFAVVGRARRLGRREAGRVDDVLLDLLLEGHEPLVGDALLLLGQEGGADRLLERGVERLLRCRDGSGRGLDHVPAVGALDRLRDLTGRRAERDLVEGRDGLALLDLAEACPPFFFEPGSIVYCLASAANCASLAGAASRSCRRSPCSLTRMWRTWRRGGRRVALLVLRVVRLDGRVVDLDGLRQVDVDRLAQEPVAEVLDHGGLRRVVVRERPSSTSRRRPCRRCPSRTAA